MTEPKSYIGVLKAFRFCPQWVQSYYEHLPQLIESGFPFEISIAYLFMKLEQAYHRILYGGCAKLHLTDKEITWAALASWHLTREDFLIKFQNIYGKELPRDLKNQLAHAESVRDSIMHGKSLEATDQRKAITDLLRFSNEIDEYIFKNYEWRPFADMRGITGAAEKLDKSTTRWVLKGMGFSLS